MDWRIKAFIQKILAASQAGDKLNHYLVTLNRKYHQNVFTYQSHEALRKFSCTKLDLTQNLAALEIGTGYSLISAVTLSLLGFEKTITVDITVDIDISSFKKQFRFANEEYIEKLLAYSKYSKSELADKIEQINGVSRLDDLFRLLNIIYIAPYQFEDVENHIKKIDYLSSQVVLEHIAPNLLEILFEKTNIWLTPIGYCVHTINFIDHFANPGFFQDRSISEFNFLKFSDKYWETWAGNSIAYTNRLSALFYIELAKKYNLEIVDFQGENYRPRVELDSSLIHADVIKKYYEIPNLDSLTEFQRGTLILRLNNSASS